MFLNIHHLLNLTPVKLEVEKQNKTTLNSEWLWPYCAQNEPSAIQCTMRKNLPKTLDQLIFCKYTLVFSKCSQIY